MEIIVKKYSHYNRSMGKYINSKKQYDEEMKKGGYISYDEACRRADKIQSQRDNPDLKPSRKVLDIIESAKNSKDKKGNVKLSDRTIDAMKELGVGFNHPHTPNPNKKEGGFE